MLNYNAIVGHCNHMLFSCKDNFDFLIREFANLIHIKSNTEEYLIVNKSPVKTKALDDLAGEFKVTMYKDGQPYTGLCEGCSKAFGCIDHNVEPFTNECQYKIGDFPEIVAEPIMPEPCQLSSDSNFIFDDLYHNKLLQYALTILGESSAFLIETKGQLNIVIAGEYKLEFDYSEKIDFYTVTVWLNNKRQFTLLLIDTQTKPELSANFDRI
jgi:hypothetical protein